MAEAAIGPSSLARAHIENAAAVAAERRLAAEEKAQARERLLLTDAERYLAGLKAHAAKLELFVHRPEALQLGLLSLLLLINVDSHTRDDLLTLTTLRVSAQLLRPGLLLDEYTLSLLAELFEALGVSYGLMRRLAQSDAMIGMIVPSQRSGEWLLVDGLYADFLADAGKNHLAEPLGGILKLQTLAHADLSRLEATTQTLAASLGVAGGAGQAVAARRTQFFWAVAAMVGACARSAFHENLATPFVARLSELAAGHALPANVQAANAEALATLTAARAHLAHGPPEDTDADPTADPIARDDRSAYRLDAFRKNLPELLDARGAAHHATLRRVVLLQLHLLALGRYLTTGSAAKLAFVISAPDFRPEHASLFWLAELHLALAGFGLDLPTLAEAMRHLAPDHHEPQMSFLMTHGHARRDLTAFTTLLLQLLPLLRKAPEEAQAGPARRFLAMAHELQGSARQPAAETLLFLAAASQLLNALLIPRAATPPAPPSSPASSPRGGATQPRTQPKSPRARDPDVYAAKLAEAERAVSVARPPLPAEAPHPEAARALAELLTDLVTWTEGLVMTPKPKSPRAHASRPRIDSPQDPAAPPLVAGTPLLARDS